MSREAIKTAWVLRPASNPVQLHLYGGVDGELEVLQRELGGYVQALPVAGHPRLTAWCGEEAKLQGRPKNVAATAAMEGSIYPGDWIAGNLVLTLNDGDGIGSLETLPAPFQPGAVAR